MTLLYRKCLLDYSSSFDYPT